jgi:hypothetical protein
MIYEYSCVVTVSQSCVAASSAKKVASAAPVSYYHVCTASEGMLIVTIRLL